MTVGKRLRFDVFTRDGFTCRYCGRTPPSVVLEVDHIHPRSEGGLDELTNLCTACLDCNRGKSSSRADPPNYRAEEIREDAFQCLTECIAHVWEQTFDRHLHIRRVFDSQVVEGFFRQGLLTPEVRIAVYQTYTWVEGLGGANAADAWEYFTRWCISTIRDVMNLPVDVELLP